MLVGRGRSKSCRWCQRLGVQHTAIHSWSGCAAASHGAVALPTTSTFTSGSAASAASSIAVKRAILPPEGSTLGVIMDLGRARIHFKPLRLAPSSRTGAAGREPATLTEPISEPSRGGEQLRAVGRRTHLRRKGDEQWGNSGGEGEDKGAGEGKRVSGSAAEKPWAASGAEGVAVAGGKRRAWIDGEGVGGERAHLEATQLFFSQFGSQFKSDDSCACGARWGQTFVSLRA